MVYNKKNCNIVNKIKLYVYDINFYNKTNMIRRGDYMRFVKKKLQEKKSINAKV
jgi:hypothetical protein